MSKGKRIFRRIAIGFGVVLVVCIALVMAVYGFLQTETGRDQIAQFLAWYLSRPGETEVSIARLDGPLPQRVHLSGLRARDREGEWFSLDSAIIEWRPLQLLRGRLHVTRADVSNLRLVRLGTDADQGKGPGGFGFPTLPVAIAVDRFVFEDVHLGESVIGVQASMRAVGESAVAADGTTRTTVSVERTDGTRGHAALSMVFLPRTEQLSVQVEIDEAEGGLIAHLLSLPGLPPVSFGFNGDGPLTSWRGRLIARAGNLISIETDIKVSRTERYSLVAQGQADVARLVDDPIRQMLFEVVSYRFEVDFTDWEMIVLRRARLASDVALVDLAGRLVRGQAELKVALSLTPRGLETLNGLLAPASATGMTVRGTLSGPAMQPEGRLEFTVTDPTIDSVSAQVFRGSFSLRPDRELGMADLKVMVAGQGQLEGLRPSASEVLGETVDWDIEGQISMEGQIIDLARLNLSADIIRAVASGNVSLVDGRGDGALRLEIDDLTRLTPDTGLSPRGNLIMEARLHTGDITQKLSATITGELRDLSLGYPTVDALLGHRVALASNLTMVTDGGVRIDSVEISGANAKIEGALSLTPEYRILDGRYTLSLDDLAVLSTELRTPLGGSMTVEGTVMGDLADPKLQGSASAADTQIRDFHVGLLQGTFTLESFAQEPRGSVSLTLTDPPFGPADASARFLLAGGSHLQLDGLSVRTRETEVVGDLVIPLQGPPVEGSLSGHATSLEAWSELVGRTIAGAISFELRMHPDGTRQAADLGVEGSHVEIGVAQTETVGLGRVKLSAQLTDLTESPRGKLTVETEEAHLAGATITGLLLTSDAASVDAVDFRVRTVGDFRGPFDLDMAGGVTREGHMLRLTLGRLNGRIAGRSLALQQVARVEYGPGVFTADNVVLDVEEGRIAGRGRIARGDISGTLDVAKLPLSLMEVVWPGLGLSGVVDGHGRVSGPMKNASGQLEVTLSDVRVTAWAGDVRPLSGTFGGDWSSGRLKVRGNIGDGGQTNLEVQAEVPLQLTGTGPPPDFTVPATEPVSGRLAWRGTLAPVSELLALDNARVSGRADLGLDIGGTIRSPQLRGHLTVSDGEYEHFTAGTVIRGIELEFRADENRLTLARAVGSDGSSGRLTANGTLDLDRTRNFPGRLTMKFKNAALVRRDELTASASGEITFDGTLENALLSGQIETNKVDARIPDRSPSEVVKLDVVEVNHPNARPKGEVPQKPVEKSLIQLNLDLILPKRVFIRGRGLDSEWSGKLRVTGTFHAPIVEGELRPVRGEFSFAGKIFALGEGSIRFDGSEKIDPTLNLAAKYSVSDFTATIGISGPASRPEITLTSDPSLPQSEIASRILFGKTTGQLSALEAAQLAEAVASLSGKGGGGQGILDLARRTLGVDVLRVSGGAEEGEGPTVTVGKYVTEKVFVGVTQGTQPGTGFTTVGVEVTPNISVESNVGQDGRSDVGVKWKWDY